VTFFLRHWFLIALATVLSAGFAWPMQLAPVADVVPRSWLIATVLFLMALPMPLTQLAATVRNSGPAWLAVAINSGLAPILGWGAGTILPASLSTGLLIATAVPCTMASAAIWTRRGGGNEASVLLVTIVTSLACFLVLPAWLWLFLSAEVAIDFSALAIDLLLRVVLPIFAAQVLRQVGDIGGWATKHRIALSTLSQIGILFMLLAGAVTSSQVLGDSSANTPSSFDWLLLIVAIVGVHCLLLWIGWELSRRLGFPYAERVAVAMAGSQKTLPVGLEVAAKFGGLTVLPMVLYHVAQLVIDTLVVERLRVRHGSAAATESEPAR
jgi:sodium/bile acid cotransporter 7